MDPINIFLDDERSPNNYDNYPENCVWIICRNFDSFKETVLNAVNKNIPIDTISFDHDLGDIRDGIEYDGYFSAKWLANNNVKFRQAIVHSWNTVGKDNIWYYMNNYQEHTNNLKIVAKIQLNLKK
jgi:hypothetical protein